MEQQETTIDDNKMEIDSNFTSPINDIVLIVGDAKYLIKLIISFKNKSDKILLDIQQIEVSYQPRLKSSNTCYIVHCGLRAKQLKLS